jgi:two-component system response regulator YesN
MIRTLIVDDEPAHVEGLVRHIRWAELGYEPPLSAESGEAALAVLERERVDVLVTDVSMPGMTGIELLARCRSEYPHLQQMEALIVSGYDEFEFVHEAIHLGAKGYVLKPVKPAEIEEKLAAIRDSIDKRSRIEREIGDLKEKVNMSLAALRERFVQELADGRIHSEELLISWSRLLDIPGTVRHLSLVVFGCDRLHHAAFEDARERIALGAGFAQAVKLSLSDCAGVFVGQTGTDEVAALLLDPAPSERAKLEKQLPFVQDVVWEQFGSTVTIGITRPCREWKEVPLLYKEAQHMMAKSRLIGYGQTVRFTRFEESEFVDFRLREEYIPAIVKRLESGETAEAADLLHRAFDLMLAHESVSLSFVQAFAMGLVSELTRKLKPGREEDGGFDILMWQRLIDCTSVTEIREAVWECANRFIRIDRKKKEALQHHLVHQVAQHIREHIRDNVTVKQLAELYHINASYLSVLFKKETGRTISDFVQDVRISKAKELLRDPAVKVYEVAERVGFQSPAYFAYLFKKTTGYTPQEFRDYRYEE